MKQDFRVTSGVINRDRPIHFKFNGKSFTGYEGDTVASALLANGVLLFGRSFKYHRPRGVISSGSEEPNALMTIGKDANAEPNTRATTVEIQEGMEVFSQNHIGSLRHDLQAVNDFLSPLFAAGFYYKTFMWPKSFWEKLYEPAIRRAAGLGKLSKSIDPDQYDKGYIHCDLLVIGSGLAGLTSALMAAQSGAKIVLADEDFVFGGRINCDENADLRAWKSDTIAALAEMDNVRLMSRTTVNGSYDQGVYSALERIENRSSAEQPRQILWRIYAKQSILAAGAIERPIAFVNNDRPGIMLAGALRNYVQRFGVLPGKKIAIYTNNDDGWQTLRSLENAGAQELTIIDSRDVDPVVKLADTSYHRAQSVVDTKGRLALREVILQNGETLEADILAVSGGWNPNVHLSAHQGARPVWNSEIESFVPSENLPAGMHVAGAAAGHFEQNNIVQSAKQATQTALAELGYKLKKPNLPVIENRNYAIQSQWVPQGSGRAWLDFQNDVTVKDVKLAHQEGYVSVEHLKRYTTLGMATDQGKTSNVNAMAVMAHCSGKTIEETGTTMFRPPYTPISIGALAGRSRGKHFRPVRLTPSHKWSEEQGAAFVETGMWKRAQWFAKTGETHWRETVDREVKQVRNSVGICDVSTLGKIDIQGADAAEFLNIVYANPFGKLPIGKVRYGLMLREDGMAMDDGTTARFAEDHFVMTTTTANAVGVFRHLEFVRQCLRPDLDVHLISTTEAWAQFAVAGPNARKLLEKIVDDDFDISNDGFPFMACAQLSVCNGTPARLFRISFSGELAYEIAVPTRYGDALIREMLKAGDEFGAVPYGTEALGVMRIEKGHAAGNELTGQTTALNLSMPGIVSKNKDCIGKTMSTREHLNKEDALRLVGLKPVDQSQQLLAGMHFVDKGEEALTQNDLGWLSSACYSPMLETSIGIGFLKSGHERMGEKIHAVDLLSDARIEVEIVSAHFIDPEGERLRV